MLCWSRMCFAIASERVKDLSHSIKRTSVEWSYYEEIQCNIPGRGQVNGFSPVCAECSARSGEFVEFKTGSASSIESSISSKSSNFAATGAGVDGVC